MAHEIKRVTNDQVLEALRGIGINITGPLDMTGAQNSTWKLKILPLIRSQLPAGQYAEDVFNRAITTAKDIAAIPPDASPIDRVSRTLQAYGVSGDDYTRIIEEAKRIRKTTPRIYDPSKEFNETEYLQAAVNILGTTPAVQQAAGRAGLQMPAPPAAQMPAGPVAPAAPSSAAIPSPPKATTGPVGGPRMQVGPGKAAGATPGAAAGAGAGAAPGGGGGGAVNQPAPPSTWNDDQIRDFIKANFGSNAYFVDIPEVWEALKTVVKSGKGVAGLEPAIEGTNFWKQNKAATRSWYVKERSDPAQAAADVAQQGQAIQNLAQQAGITIDPDRLQQMAQSYLRNGWTQADLQRAIGAEWHYDPATKDQAAIVSKMKQDARSWLVPLSDQAVDTWGHGLLGGTTTQAQFDQYLRDNAKSLLPQLSDLIDAHQGDPNFTVDHFVDPYRTQAANLLGIQSDQIDFTDPKWRRALDQVDPKTNTRRIMSLSEWQSTLKTDPQYGYDRSAQGIQDGINLAQTLKQSLGF